MAANPSSLTGAVTPTQRTRNILAIILAGLAVAAGVAWAPALLALSTELRPLEEFDVYRWCFSDAQQAQLHALVAQASQKFGVIALIFLATLVALVALSIVAGRRALRETASAAALARMGKWSLTFLVGGLALALGAYLIGSSSFLYGIQDSITGFNPLLRAVVTFLAVGIIPASEIISIILGGIALVRPTAAPASGETPPARGATGWRILTRSGLVVASLSVLALFTLVYFVGLFSIGWYPCFYF